MKIALTLALAFLAQATTPPWAQSVPPWQTYFAPDEDLGTVPSKAEVTHYLLVQSPSIHGMRVVHDLNPRLQYVYEFVDVGSLLQPHTSTTNQVSTTWSYGEDMLAEDVFSSGSEIETSWLQVCVSAPCAVENNLCTGWCDVQGFWQCVCTPIKPMETSRSAAERHQNRVEDVSRLFPPATGEAARPTYYGELAGAGR